DPLLAIDDAARTRRAIRAGSRETTDLGSTLDDLTGRRSRPLFVVMAGRLRVVVRIRVRCVIELVELRECVGIAAVSQQAHSDATSAERGHRRGHVHALRTAAAPTVAPTEQLRFGPHQSAAQIAGNGNVLDPSPER